MRTIPTFDDKKGAEFLMDLVGGKACLAPYYTRRSVRQFIDKPVEREQLFEIIKAGTWAP